MGHQSCPKGRSGSTILIDVANVQEKCTKCQQIWRLEDSILYCSCGNVQKTQYVDTILTIEQDDEILRTDGNLVYVLKRSGVVVVGQRSFPGSGYAVQAPQVVVSQPKKSVAGCLGKTLGCLALLFLLFVAIGYGLYRFATHPGSTGYYLSNLQVAASGNALDSYVSSNGSQHINFIDASGHVHELSIQAGGSTWENQDLTTLSKGSAAASTSTLDGYTGPNASDEINYIGTDGHLHELLLKQGGSWTDTDLTSVSHSVKPASGSTISGYWGSDQSEHINFIGTDHHVHELYLALGAHWVDNDLTALSGGANASSKKALAGYWGSDSSVHVNFISANGHIHELYFAQSAGHWVDNDLTSLSKGTSASPDSGLIGFWGSDSSVHVDFIGTDDHIHEYYFAQQNGHWVDNDLTTGSSGTAPAADSSLAGYWGSDNSVHVDFIGTDGHLHELYYSQSASNWVDNDLTALSGGDLPASASTLADYGESDDSLHVDFISTTGHLYEIHT